MGVILYQLCTDRFPFEDASEITIIQKHLKEVPADVRTVNPAISDELADSVMKCLEKEASNRHQTARELARDLNQCEEVKESREHVLKAGELMSRDRFRVLGLIEQGGFAEVHRVKEITTGKIYALKVLLPAMTYDKESVKRFEWEIKILHQLDHPHIIDIIDSGEVRKKELSLPYFVMPFVSGNLQTSMDQPIDADRAIGVVIDVLGALDYAHSSKDRIYHRDLKPSNVLIDTDGGGRLADFGIAKISEDSAIVTRSATLTKAAMGTGAYMAPEQIRNEKIGPQTDLYAIGVILYELSTGRRPFVAKTADQIRGMHLYVDPESPRTHNLKILPKFDALILKCLKKDPSQRFATAGELIKALEGAKHRNSWFGRAPAGFDPKKAITGLARSFKTSAPYLAAAAAVLFFFFGLSGAVAYRINKAGELPKSDVMNPAWYYPKKIKDVLGRNTGLIAALDQSAAEVESRSVTFPEKYQLIAYDFLSASEQDVWRKINDRWPALEEANAAGVALRYISKLDGYRDRVREALPRVGFNVASNRATVPVIRKDETELISENYSLRFVRQAASGRAANENIQPGDEARIHSVEPVRR